MKDPSLEAFDSDPIVLFGDWLAEAQKLEINDPDAMCLATCGSDGRPSNRMVLLKGFGNEGFKFHTNSASRKGLDLAENPYAALCFSWKSTRKQVRIEGPVKMVPEAEADDYFKTRPRARQIGAWASAQSRPLASREDLEAAVKKIERQYKGTDVPRPPYWNGYRVIPLSIEFWIGHKERLHDRFVFTRAREDDDWSGPQRLFP